jgi:hypothetical protein
MHTFSFGGVMSSGAINQETAHLYSSDVKKVMAIVSCKYPFAKELQQSLVDERGGLERNDSMLSAENSGGDAMELLVYGLNEPVACGEVAFSRCCEQKGQIAFAGTAHRF